MEHAPRILRGQPAAAYWALCCPRASEALAALIKASLRDIRAKSMLQIASDTSRRVYFLLEGWLIISKMTPEGARQIVDFVLPGHVFDPASATEFLSSTDVGTLTDARIAVIPRDDWTRYLAQHQKAQDLVTRHAAASYARMAERLLRLGTGCAQTRIAYALSELCLRSSPFGLVSGAEFRLPMTQQVLGDFVGLSSVHVSRTMRGLMDQRVLSYRDHMDIVIHDSDRLAAIAQIAPDDLRAEIIPAL
jgi:CRP-like cAMP-binding protein